MFFPEGAPLGQEDEKESEKICRRSALKFALKEKLGKELGMISSEQISDDQEKTLKDLFEKIEMPLIEILARM